MATYTQRHGSWQAKIRLTGHPTETETFPTKAEAMVWATIREQELRDGDAGKALKRTLQQAVDKFITDVIPSHRSGPMEEKRLKVMLRVLPATKQLCEITVAELTEWRTKRSREVSPGTVLREFSLLQSVFEYARRDWQWISVNPAKDVRKPMKPMSRRRTISDDEREKLLASLSYFPEVPITTLNQQIGLMLLLSLETGMRSGELVDLTWARVHLSGRFVRLEETKNGDRREVPLSRRAIELFERAKGIDKVKVFTVAPGSRDALFRYARRRVGLDDINFHDARHTAATRIGKAGRLTLLEFCAMFGWRDPRHAMVYFNPTAGELAAKLD
jgi:integrase